MNLTEKGVFMNFKEEYKSAMEKISPDENVSQKIEQAVLNEISGKTAAKKKKPFYVCAAFSGAACAAAAAIILVNVLHVRTPNNLSAETASANVTSSLTAGFEISEEFEPTDFQAANVNGSFKEQDEGVFENDADEPKDSLSSANTAEYELIFTPEGDVLLVGQNETKKYSPEGVVSHYTDNADIAVSSVKCSDSTVAGVAVKENFLYIFEEDLHTAAVYKLKN